LTLKKDTSGYVEPDSVDLRAATTRELATYLWENYIEYVYFDYDSKRVFANVSSRVNDSKDIILMGIGAAYAGVVWLLSNEGTKSKNWINITNANLGLFTEAYQDRVKHVVGFVADSSILGVSRPADDGVSSWYFNVRYILHYLFAHDS